MKVATYVHLLSDDLPDADLFAEATVSEESEQSEARAEHADATRERMEAAVGAMLRWPGPSGRHRHRHAVR